MAAVRSPERGYEHPWLRIPILVLSLLVLLGACFGDRVPDVLSVGRHLVATIDVVREESESDILEERRVPVLLIEVVEVHWVGHPEPSIVEPPAVAAGDRLLALDFPDGYGAGRSYVASLDYFGHDGAEWWLSTGIDADGNVIQRSLDRNVAQNALRVADAADGDVDSPGDLLAALAAEWEAKLNARDRGEPQPHGPMLTAMFKAAGVAVSQTVPSLEQSLDALADKPAEFRVFPTDMLEGGAGLVDGLAARLGVPMAPLEAMILHDDVVGDAASIGLWFPGLGRTAESFVDHETGVTIISSLIPLHAKFEVVGYARPVDLEAGEEKSSDVQPRLWDRSFGLFDALESAVLHNDVVGNGLDLLDNETVYMTVDLRGGNPEATTMTADEYFAVVMKMQDVFSRGNERGIGSEPD